MPNWRRIHSKTSQQTRRMQTELATYRHHQRGQRMLFRIKSFDRTLGPWASTHGEGLASPALTWRSSISPGTRDTTKCATLLLCIPERQQHPVLSAMFRRLRGAGVAQTIARRRIGEGTVLGAPRGKHPHRETMSNKRSSSMKMRVLPRSQLAPMIRDPRVALLRKEPSRQKGGTSSMLFDRSIHRRMSSWCSIHQTSFVLSRKAWHCFYNCPCCHLRSDSISGAGLFCAPP